MCDKIYLVPADISPVAVMSFEIADMKNVAVNQFEPADAHTRQGDGDFGPKRSESDESDSFLAEIRSGDARTARFERRQNSRVVEKVAFICRMAEQSKAAFRSS